MARERIVIVDDSQEIRELLSELLEGAGYEVVTFPGDALQPEQLAAARPDLMILDLILPGPGAQMSGWDYLRLARSHRTLQQVPVLLCSADIDALRTRRDEFAGDPMVRTLEKPFGIAELESAVAAAIGARPFPSWDDDADLVLVADQEANLVDASTAILRVLGLSLAELRTRRVADIVAYSREWTEREWRRYLERGTWSGRVALLAADGRRISASAQAEVVEGASDLVHVSRLVLLGPTGAHAASA